jgi:hypothetical protein
MTIETVGDSLDGTDRRASGDITPCKRSGLKGVVAETLPMK